LSAREGVDRADQSHSARLGELLCGGPLQSVLLVYPRLDREEGSEPPGEKSPAPRLWVAAVEQGLVVWSAGTLSRVPSRLPTIVLGSRPDPIGLINLVAKGAGTRSAGNPHATCDVAGTANGCTDSPHGTAPVPDPYRY